MTDPKIVPTAVGRTDARTLRRGRRRPGPRALAALVRTRLLAAIPRRSRWRVVEAAGGLAALTTLLLLNHRPVVVGPVLAVVAVAMVPAGVVLRRRYRRAAAHRRTQSMLQLEIARVVDEIYDEWMQAASAEAFVHLDRWRHTHSS